MDTAIRVARTLHYGNRRRIKTEFEAEALLLPAERLNRAEVNRKFNGFSIHGAVQKGFTKPYCQDTIALCNTNKFTMLAVMDGFGAHGYKIAEGVGRTLISSCGQLLGNTSQVAKNLLLLAEYSGRELANVYLEGAAISGTTATVLVIFKDGRYEAANSGDSTIYVFGDKTTRLFEPHLLSPTLHVGDYLSKRNELLNPISTIPLSNDDIQLSEGVFNLGEAIVLVSDGVTKNLKFLVNNDKIVTDHSGSHDIGSIVRQNSNHTVDQATHICDLVMNEIEYRARLSMDNCKNIFSDAKGKEVAFYSADDLSCLVLAS